MFDGLTIKELGVQGWERKDIDGHECVLFYQDIYRPKDDCDGFDFICVEVLGHGDNINNSTYAVLFEGIAYFDGVRHLYFGRKETDNYGYLYYQDVPRLIKALKALDDLQVSKCRYVKDERGEE